MGLSAGQTSHNSLQKSALNINGKISTKTALVFPSSTCTTPQPALAHQKWPARTGDATSPPVAKDCVRQSPKNSQPARPAHDNGPSASTTTLSAGRRFRIRSAMLAAVSSSQTTDVGRGGQEESAKGGSCQKIEQRRSPTIHCRACFECPSRRGYIHSPALMLPPSTCVTSPTSSRTLLVPPLAFPAVLPGRGSRQSRTGFGSSLVSSRPSTTRSPTLSLSTE